MSVYTKDELQIDDVCYISVKHYMLYGKTHDNIFDPKILNA